MKDWLLAVAATGVLCGSLFADTITGTGSLVGFTPPTSTQNWAGAGTAPTTGTKTPGVFWNNPSDDGSITGDPNSGNHLLNIGYLLSGTGGFAGGVTNVFNGTTDSMTGGSQYVGTSGADPTSFNFVSSAAAENITLLFADGGEDTGNTPNTSGLLPFLQIGYYQGTCTFITAGGCSNGTVLYNSVAQQTSTAALTSQPFNPTGTYGFYGIVCYQSSTIASCETYTTNGNSGPWTNYGTGDAWNHFAAFQTAQGNWIVGFTGQNQLLGENQGDFQDAVIQISSAVPEPGTAAIMGLGLAALGVLARRRFAK